MRGLGTLPKAHLHLHLTGAMRPSTLLDLAGRDGMTVPPPFPAGVRGSWADFQTRYDRARSVIRTSADIVRVVTEAAAVDAADGCGWLEIQLDPTCYAPVLGGARAAVEAVLAAAAQACIPTGVVVASSWGRSGDHAQQLARLAGEYADDGVVGFGLSNDERLGHAAEFEPAFRVAAEAGLLAVPHSGFFTGADHVRDCVELLGARRIGHGTSAAADPGVLELLVQRDVGWRCARLRIHRWAYTSCSTCRCARCSTPGWRWRWRPMTRCCSVRVWRGSTRSAATCSGCPISSSQYSPGTASAARPPHHSSGTSCCAGCATGSGRTREGVTRVEPSRCGQIGRHARKGTPPSAARVSL